MYRPLMTFLLLPALAGCLDLQGDGDESADTGCPAVARGGRSAPALAGALGHGGATDYFAAVATIAPDFSSGAHSLIGRHDGDLVTLNDVAPTNSDLTVAARDGQLFRIERSIGANVTRFATTPGADPRVPEWQFSVVRERCATPATTNPQNLVFASASKAYVLLFEQNTALIVNPSAATAGEFVLGELDLGAYADSDGVAEMHNGLVADGKLFITLQRWDRNDSFFWALNNTPYVAVFDVASDTEIDTGQDPDPAIKGIPLDLRNPDNDIAYVAAENALYVQGAGDLFAGTASGGIVRIDLADYRPALLVDDDDPAASHGQTTAMAVSAPDRGYLVGGAYDENFEFRATLYPFDPRTGVLGPAVAAGLSDVDITDISFGPDANLWVSDATTASVHVIDPSDHRVVATLDTNLNPGQVVFFASGN